MQLESRRVENIIRYWILMEEWRIHREEMTAKAAGIQDSFDTYRRIPEYCMKPEPHT